MRTPLRILSVGNHDSRFQTLLRELKSIQTAKNKSLKIESAGSIAEVLECLKNLPLDAVILTGKSVKSQNVKELRETAPTLYILALFDNIDDEMQSELKDVGASEILPFSEMNGTSLIHIIQYAVGMRKNEASLKTAQEKLDNMRQFRIREQKRIDERRELEVIERNLVDEALRESEQRFRNIVFSMAGWIWEINVDGNFTYCSEKATEFLGFTPDEIVNTSIFNILVTKDRNTFETVFTDARNERLPMEDVETWAKHKSGDAVCLLISGIPIFDDEGRLEGYRGVAKDITAQKKAEEEREKLIKNLEDALSKIKTLRGLIPICASCKKIRDDKGYWNKLEAFIETHSEAEFSHGICPDCLTTLYPDIMDDPESVAEKEEKEEKTKE